MQRISDNLFLIGFHLCNSISFWMFQRGSATETSVPVRKFGILLDRAYAYLSF